jgi:DNA-binding transcriptional MerR regulator
MLSTSDMAAIAVLATGLSVANIARIVRHEPTPDAWALAQYSEPRLDAPEIEDNRFWLERKAAERERAFQAQQRQQAEERRELRWERRLDAGRQRERERPGWPGR